MTGDLGYRQHRRDAFADDERGARALVCGFRLRFGCPMTATFSPVCDLPTCAGFVDQLERAQRTVDLDRHQENVIVVGRRRMEDDGLIRFDLSLLPELLPNGDVERPASTFAARDLQCGRFVRSGEGDALELVRIDSFPLSRAANCSRLR